MSEQYYLQLKPTEWHQHLSTANPITEKPARRVLTTVCRVEHVPVQLTSGELLEDMLVDVMMEPWIAEADNLRRGKMGLVSYLRMRESLEISPVSIRFWMQPAALR
jgi:hypothetical protein